SRRASTCRRARARSSISCCRPSAAPSRTRGCSPPAARRSAARRPWRPPPEARPHTVSRSEEHVGPRLAHQRLEQPRERSEPVVARRHVVRVTEETRQVFAVLRLAVTVLQAAEDAEHLEVALQPHPFELPPEVAEVVGHRQAPLL